MCRTVDESRMSSWKGDFCLLAEATAFGGAEVHTVRLIEAMLRRGRSVKLVECGSTYYLHNLGGLPTERFTYESCPDRTSDLDDQAMARWRARLETIEAPALVIPSGDVLRGDLGFFWLCKRRFRRIYVVQHTEARPIPPVSTRRLAGVIPLGLGWWRWKIILGRLLSSFLVDRYIAVSNQVKESLVENFHIRSVRVVVVPNGIPVRHFRRDETLGRSFRQRWGIPEQAFVFGMLARLVPEKGVNFALEAAAILSRRVGVDRFRMVVAGDGPAEAALRKQALDLGIVKIVVFQPFTPDTRAVLSSYDVVLLPSNYEALPLALLEGMAAGCIPIVSNVGFMPDVVSGPHLGRVVPAGDVPALSAAMGEILDMGERELAGMRSAVSTYTAQNFDGEASNGRILDLLEGAHC